VDTNVPVHFLLKPSLLPHKTDRRARAHRRPSAHAADGTHSENHPGNPCTLESPERRSRSPFALPTPPYPSAHRGTHTPYIVSRPSKRLKSCTALPLPTILPSSFHRLTIHPPILLSRSVPPLP
jgi:hypothetical protein